MIKNLLGKFVSASQSAKQELKKQAEDQVRELRAKLDAINTQFQLEAAPTNASLRGLDDRRFALETQVGNCTAFLKKHAGSLAGSGGSILPQKSEAELENERERQRLKSQIEVLRKDIKGMELSETLLKQMLKQ